MQDRLFETRTFPQHFPLKQFRHPVLFAPHPDDEVFGCGGLLALWGQEGIHAKVVVLTDGQAQGEESQRQIESQAAANFLGNYSLDFWHLPDREVRSTAALVERISTYLKDHQADVLLVPALHEPHPDHQACTLAAIWSLAKLPKPVDVCFYESGTALVHCTHLVDISSVQEQKMQAMQAFSSQEDVQPYSSRITALNHFRALTLGPQAQAAEALQWLPLAKQGWAALIPALDPLFLHARGQAVTPQDLPLVSVLVRTVGDPRLEQTIASICAQTYPQIEIIVVAAHGESKAPDWLNVLQQARWISLQRPLTRPEAANVALDNAKGEYCIFLDDDDLFVPVHIEKLVERLNSEASVKAAHTDTQVVNTQDEEVLRYDRPYQSHRLVFTNIFPIHSVLFKRNLVAELGCRFDENLPVLEDWDFWLQVSQFTSFAHVPGCSAIYRYNDRSQLQGDTQHVHHHLHWREQVMDKWLTRFSAHQIGSAGAWYAQKLDYAEQHFAYSQKMLEQTQHDLQQTQHDLQQTQHDLQQTQHDLQQTHQHLHQITQERQQAQHLLENCQQYLQKTQQEADQQSQHMQQQLLSVQSTLEAIYASRGWRLLGKLRSIKQKLWMR